MILACNVVSSPRLNAFGLYYGDEPTFSDSIAETRHAFWWPRH